MSFNGLKNWDERYSSGLTPVVSEDPANGGQMDIVIEIAWIEERVRKGEYYFSKHGDQERQNDNLTILEVEEALLAGRIIEKYHNTGRGESVLIAGFTEAGKPIHIVCGIRGDAVVIITVYIPRPPKFKTLYERGDT